MSLVIPIYNEADGIEASLRALDRAFSERRAEFVVDFVLVDDGSLDDSLALCAEVAPTLSFPVTLVTHDLNQGLGGALRSGIARTVGEVVLVVDSDLSYGISDLMRILDEQVATAAHVVIASPYMEGGRSIAVPPALERRSRWANKILSWAAIDNLATLTGMVRAYDGEHIRAMSLKAVDVDINSEILYKTQCLRGSIVEVPATLNWSSLEQRAGRSGLLSRRSRWNTAKSLVNAFLFRPFIFPLLPVPVLLLLSVVLLWVGDLRSVAVGAVAIGLAALLCVVSLLMLQLKRYFEELFSVISRQGRFTDHPRHARLVLATTGSSQDATVVGDPTPTPVTRDPSPATDPN